MKLTAKLLAHLHECYHPGEPVLESEPAALDALMAFATQMLPVRDALVRKVVADQRVTAGWAVGRGRESLAAFMALDKLAYELAETNAETEP